MQTDSHYVHILREALSKKQNQNAAYSLRAFGRDLGVHPATLSQVFKGNRPLPIKNLKNVIKRLGLSPREATLFAESLHQKKTRLDAIVVNPSDERFMLDESYFRVLAEWEHYAVLTLMDVKTFTPTPSEISTHLGITKIRAEVVLEHLLRTGLLARDGEGRIVKAQPSVRTTEDVESQALQASHKEVLETGIRKLQEVEVELRDFSSMNLAIDMEKLTEAKTIIREFRRKMASLLRDGNKTDVYQLGIQFYPLTKPNLKGTEK